MSANTKKLLNETGLFDQTVLDLARRAGAAALELEKEGDDGLDAEKYQKALEVRGTASALRELARWTPDTPLPRNRRDMEIRVSNQCLFGKQDDGATPERPKSEVIFQASSNSNRLLLNVARWLHALSECAFWRGELNTDPRLFVLMQHIQKLADEVTEATADNAECS